MKETQEKRPEKRRSFIVRLALWPLKGKGWRRWARLTVALLVLYNLYACVTMRRPPVWGRVVNMETGRPIAGAEVYVEAAYAVLGPGGPAGPGGSGLGHGTTSASGFFFIPAKGHLVVGPWWTLATGLGVYSPDYVTCATEREGIWARGNSCRPSRYAKVWWLRIPIVGHVCCVAIARAETEEQWRQKCETTIQVRELSRYEHTDQWLLNDLTGYLRKWPEGKDSERFLSALFDTAYLCTPDRIEDDLSSRRLTKADLVMLYKRDMLILEKLRQIPLASPEKKQQMPGLSAKDQKFLEQSVQNLQRYVEETGGSHAR